MDWQSYLKTALRMVDLHDSRHSEDAVASPITETRPGANDGFWLDIGIRILEYLNQQEETTNVGWVPLEPLFQDLETELAVSRDALQWVVTFLATPTEFAYRTYAANTQGPQIARTKETNLVERPPNQSPDRARLTKTGRLAVQLSQTSEEWLYTHRDASKITDALKVGRFEDIPRQCSHLIASMRTFSQEIRRALERPGYEEAAAFFFDKNEHYLESIRNTQNAVEQAYELFYTQSTQDLFDAWSAGKDPDEVTDLAYSIPRGLHELMQAVESLNRRFSEFVSRMASEERPSVGGVRFDKAATHLAYDPPSSEVIEQAFRVLAPWQFGPIFPDPTADLRGVIENPDREAPKREPLVFSEEEGEPPPHLMDQFLEQYRHEIEAVLQDRPLPLSEAIRNGWIRIEGNEGLHLGPLVGIYTAPEWLGDDEAARMAISIRKGGLDLYLPDGSHLIGDDLIITLLPSGEAIYGTG